MRFFSNLFNHSANTLSNRRLQVENLEDRQLLSVNAGSVEFAETVLVADQEVQPEAEPVKIDLNDAALDDCSKFENLAVDDDAQTTWCDFFDGKINNDFLYDSADYHFFKYVLAFHNPNFYYGDGVNLLDAEINHLYLGNGNDDVGGSLEGGTIFDASSKLGSTPGLVADYSSKLGYVFTFPELSAAYNDNVFFELGVPRRPALMDWC